MERIVNEDMSWLSDADQKKILVPLMLMRRFEVEYRLTREDPPRRCSTTNARNSRKASPPSSPRAVMKQSLTEQVKTYTDAFAEWIANSGKISRSTAIITAETRQMLPAADEIIASAGRKASEAAEHVAASQARTKLLIIGIGIAIVGSVCC